MIHNIYLIEADSGLCFTHKDYTKDNLKSEEDFVSAFLSAMTTLGREVSEPKGELKVIDIKKYSFVLYSKENILIIVVVDNKDNMIITSQKIKVLMEKFLNKYERINSWQGNTKIFDDFKSTIDKVLDYGKISEKIQVPLLLSYKEALMEFREFKKKIDLKDGKNVPWSSGNKLPSQVVNQGFITELDYRIANLSNGLNRIKDIASKVDCPKDKVLKSLNNLKNLELIEYTKKIDLEKCSTA